MAVPRLTLRSAELRAVSVPLKRPVVSKVGLFDRRPLILIDLHTEEGALSQALGCLSRMECRATGPFAFNGSDLIVPGVCGTLPAHRYSLIFLAD
jgi:hypothetical protein